MTTKTMKAINIAQFHTSDISTLAPSKIPQSVPKDDQFLIRITHCSPQHADILHGQGKHQNNNPKHGWCHPPFVLGFDFAGIVQTTPTKGNQKRNLKGGDRVFGAALGAFAEYICVTEDSIRKVPDQLTSETAVAMSGQAVSYAAVVHMAKVQPGETVLVSGASGGLGSVCCMVAKASGAQVVALTSDHAKAEHMRKEMNVDLVLVQEGNWIEQVLKFTNGRGAEVCLDNTGMVNDAIPCLAYFGRIIVLGFAARKGVMEEVKMNKLLLKSITVTGYRFGESGRRFPKQLEEIWEGYLEMLESGRVKPIIYGKYEGLEDIGRALSDLQHRKVSGKIVVSVADAQVESKL